MTSQLIIKRVYPPKQIAPGKWRVGMVADLIQKNRVGGEKSSLLLTKIYLSVQ